ncbi:hypothetical protein KAR91_29610 [Candidatus Pacearchaeota archaeon]|nr:hypothetical protein [Candidatus Pacearchaeota archaeon]
MEDINIEEELGLAIEGRKDGLISKVMGFLKRSNPEIFLYMSVLLVIQFLPYIELYVTVIIGALIATAFAAYKKICIRLRAEIQLWKDKFRETEFKLFQAKFELEHK